MDNEIYLLHNLNIIVLGNIYFLNDTRQSQIMTMASESHSLTRWQTHQLNLHHPNPLSIALRRFCYHHFAYSQGLTILNISIPSYSNSSKSSSSSSNIF
jgi:hypothetical protein